MNRVAITGDRYIGKPRRTTASQGEAAFEIRQFILWTGDPLLISPGNLVRQSNSPNVAEAWDVLSKVPVYLDGRPAVEVTILCFWRTTEDAS